MSQHRALVTGATGFVGAHLARRLCAHGWEVHLIVRPKSDLSLLADITSQVTVHQHDRTTEGMVSLVEAAAPDVVFHLASLFLAQHRPEEVEPLVRSNVLFGLQLLEGMAASGVHRLVNTGTSWQHYKNRSYSPVNLYAATKEAFEAIIQYYLETTPLHVITLKLFDTYGPDDPRPKLFTMLRRLAMAKEPLAMSPGEQLIDLVYIDDVIDAFVLAAERLDSVSMGGHERYAVSSGAPLPLKTLVALYGRIIDKELSIEWGGRPYRPREVMVPWNNGELLPGWQAKVALEEGVALMEGSARKRCR